MNYKMICRFLGLMLAVGAIFLLPALVISLCYGRWTASIAFAATFGIMGGVAGLLLVGGTNHTISTTTIGGRGFTAIMVSWLAKFNPLFMVMTTFLIIFLEQGSKQLTSDFGISSSIADISTGIILLFIIGCEFFLQYRIVLNKNRKEAVK